MSLRVCCSVVDVGAKGCASMLFFCSLPTHTPSAWRACLPPTYLLPPSILCVVVVLHCVYVASQCGHRGKLPQGFPHHSQGGARRGVLHHRDGLRGVQEPQVRGHTADTTPHTHALPRLASLWHAPVVTEEPRDGMCTGAALCQSERTSPCHVPTPFAAASPLAPPLLSLREQWEPERQRAACRGLLRRACSHAARASSCRRVSAYSRLPHCVSPPPACAAHPPSPSRLPVMPPTPPMCFLWRPSSYIHQTTLHFP